MLYTKYYSNIIWLSLSYPLTFYHFCESTGQRKTRSRPPRKRTNKKSWNNAITL